MSRFTLAICRCRLLHHLDHVRADLALRVEGQDVLASGAHERDLPLVADAHLGDITDVDRHIRTRPADHRPPDVLWILVLPHRADADLALPLWNHTGADIEVLLSQRGDERIERDAARRELVEIDPHLHFALAPAEHLHAGHALGALQLGLHEIFDVVLQFGHVAAEAGARRYMARVPVFRPDQHPRQVIARAGVDRLDHRPIDVKRILWHLGELVSHLVERGFLVDADVKLQPHRPFALSRFTGHLTQTAERLENFLLLLEDRVLNLLGTGAEPARGDGDDRLIDIRRELHRHAEQANHPEDDHQQHHDRDGDKRCLTRTTVALGPPGNGDEVYLGAPSGLVAAPGPFADAVRRQLDVLRGEAGCACSFRVATRNTFPEAAGIASSASGFAALTVAAAAALGLERSPEELSCLARRSGSGSAARSCFGGYVEWPAGEGEERAHAFALAPAEHWEVHDVVAVVEAGAKPVSSREGHARAPSSPYFERRLEQLPARLAAVREAIAARSLVDLGPILEQEAVDLHLIAMSSRPAIFYWKPGTLAVLAAVRELREKGVAAWCTMDAGPNVHVICEPPAAERVARALEELSAVREVIRDRVGSGPRLVSEALF